MFPDDLDRTTKAAIGLGALLFLLAGAGWAAHGNELFVTAVMSGLAGCL